MELPWRPKSLYPKKLASHWLQVTDLLEEFEGNSDIDLVEMAQRRLVQQGYVADDYRTEVSYCKEVGVSYGEGERSLGHEKKQSVVLKQWTVLIPTRAVLVEGKIGH